MASFLAAECYFMAHVQLQLFSTNTQLVVVHAHSLSKSCNGYIGTASIHMIILVLRYTNNIVHNFWNRTMY